MKLCKDCAHYEENDTPSMARCLATETSIKSPVDGSTRIIGGFCEMERQRHGDCGPDASLFVPKEKTA